MWRERSEGVEDEIEKTAVRLLKKIRPSPSRERVETLLMMMLAINPKFDTSQLVAWLRQALPETAARKIIKTILTTHRGPFSFVLDSYLGWMIVLPEEGSKKSLSVSCCEDKIVRVPYLDTLTNETDSSTAMRLKLINAEIHVGDEINLRSLPKLWYTVHEIRPQSNSVLLIATSNGKKCKLKGREYKEVFCLSLIGCTVKRTAVVECPLHYPRSCFCQSVDHPPILFKFPQPDASQTLESLAILVNEESGSFGAVYSDVEAGPDDHIVKMQRASFVSVWLEKKRNILAAKKYLGHIHGTLSFSRVHWLAVGRALRVVSLGGRDLLDSWKEWTDHSLLFEESPSFNSIWLQFRPPTNADHPDILRARNYLQDRKQVLFESNNVSLSEQEITVSLYSDPLARAVLEDAKKVLKNACLEYWPENQADRLIDSLSSSPFCVPAPITVPCAVYTCSWLQLSEHSASRFHSSSHFCRSQIGNFEEMSTCDAMIRSGDMFSLSDNGYDYPHSPQSPQQWYLVHEIDLLFARILVSRCLGPPFPWVTQPSDQPNNVRHWIAVSKLWHALICSPQLPFNREKQTIQYRMFITPIPDPVAAVKLLKRLSERSPSSELGAAHAAHLLQKTRRTSQQNSINRIILDVLEATSTTITLCWCCSGDTDYFLRDENGPTHNPHGAVREEIGPVRISLRHSTPHTLSEWMDVYTGLGRGCMIEHLSPATAYHIRLTPVHSLPSHFSQHQRDDQRAIRGSVYISVTTEQKENEEKS